MIDARGRSAQSEYRCCGVSEKTRWHYLGPSSRMGEMFVGEVVLPDFYKTYKDRSFFFDAVELLHSGGRHSGRESRALLTEGQAEPLDNLRKKYNKMKHRPDTQVSLRELLDICTDAKMSLEAVIATGVGTLKSMVFEGASMFWIGGTDYFHQGITEVFVYMPLESDRLVMPPLLLSFFSKMDSRDALMASLGEAGDLHDADKCLPPEEVIELRHGDDSLSPRIYVGSFKPLLNALKRFRGQLVDNNLYNVHGLVHRWAPFTTLILILEYCRGRQGAQDLTKEEVVSYVRSALAGVKLSTELRGAQIAHEVDAVLVMLRQLPSVAWTPLSGPVWLDTESFFRLASIRNIYASDNQMAISPDLRVILDAGRP